MSYGDLGTLMAGFSIFLVYMAMSIFLFLYFTAMDLDVSLRLFTNSVAFLCFLESKTLSLIMVVVALKFAFSDEVLFIGATVHLQFLLLYPWIFLEAYSETRIMGLHSFKK